MHSCNICESKHINFSGELIIFKKKIKLYSCINCQYTFTEKPYWLEKSYNQVINDTDVGLISRNLFNSNLVFSIIKYFGIKNSNLIDLAGGYGLLVRLLRDKNIDAYWYDKFCKNIFAKGFEGKKNLFYNMATGFEFIEHIEHPLLQFKEIFEKFSNNFLFSTLLLPNPTPKASDWWYYGQEHGQHISFYRVKTLEHIAHKFGKNLSTNRHNYHLIGDKKINYITFKILIKFCTLHNFLIKSDQKYLKNDYLKNINQ